MSTHKESGKPLNEIVNEVEEFDSPEIFVNMEKRTLERRTVRRSRSVPTIYSTTEISKISCAAGEHIYYMFNRNTWDAACMKCTKHKFLDPLSQTIRNGHIVNRATGDILD